MIDLASFGQVVLIDLVLAGDNAVVIGALAAGLPAVQRRQAILFGMGLAIVARIVFSVSVVWLLMIPGLTIVGGLLLLWVAWKMWKDLRSPEASGAAATIAPQLHKAVFAIAAADISMSLDNVLGVAGAAQGHIVSLVFGLALSITLMGAAANLIAKVIERHRWIAYVGLALILFVALRMIFGWLL